MKENPFFRNLRREALEEKRHLENMAEMAEEKDDPELSPEEIEKIADDMYQKMKDATWHIQEYTDSLPSLYRQLADLSGEWRGRSSVKNRSEASLEESLRQDFFASMSHAAYDEVERIEYLMEEYL